MRKNIEKSVQVDYESCIEKEKNGRKRKRRCEFDD